MTPRTQAHGLRGGAEALAANLPPLLAEARHLAATVEVGLHGRRRAGQGDEFWQYRQAQPGDEARRVDWRRSARSDQTFLREQEWQAAQSVQIWVDGAASMDYASAPEWPAKGDRARLLALALSILLERAGERFGLTDGVIAPRTGRAQLARVAEALAQAADARCGAPPEASHLMPGARALFLTDGLGDPKALTAAILGAADRGVKGAILQVLDPAEAEFPFAGSAIFESMIPGLWHQTRDAAGLRQDYLARLGARRAQLEDMTHGTGWVYSMHRTDHSAASALLWIYQAIGQGF